MMATNSFFYNKTYGSEFWKYVIKVDRTNNDSWTFKVEKKLVPDVIRLGARVISFGEYLLVGSG